MREREGETEREGGRHGEREREGGREGGSGTHLGQLVELHLQHGGPQQLLALLIDEQLVHEQLLLLVEEQPLLLQRVKLHPQLVVLQLALQLLNLLLLDCHQLLGETGLIISLHSAPPAGIYRSDSPHYTLFSVAYFFHVQWHALRRLSFTKEKIRKRSKFRLD